MPLQRFQRNLQLCPHILQLGRVLWLTSYHVYAVRWVLSTAASRRGLSTRETSTLTISMVTTTRRFLILGKLLSDQKVVPGSGRAVGLRLIKKYLGHRLVARPETDTFWTDSTPRLEIPELSEPRQGIWTLVGLGWVCCVSYWAAVVKPGADCFPGCRHQQGDGITFCIHTVRLTWIKVKTRASSLAPLLLCSTWQRRQEHRRQKMQPVKFPLLTPQNFLRGCCARNSWSGRRYSGRNGIRISSNERHHQPPSRTLSYALLYRPFWKRQTSTVVI